MGTHYNTDIVLCDGPMNIAAYAKSARFEATCDELDTTPMGSTDGYQTLIAGAKSGLVDVSLMAEHTNGGLDEVQWAQHGVLSIPKSFAIGSADGSVAYTMNGIALSYSPFGGEVGQLAMASVKGRSASSPVVRGKVLHPLGTARSASGTGTGRQLGAVVAGKSVYAALHVASATGTTPSLTVKVQSDDNGSFTTPTDRITFTAETDATSHYQWGSAAGAITDDYWRASWTISGTGPSFTFLLAVGIV